jgi:serine/threonine protein kinase
MGNCLVSQSTTTTTDSKDKTANKKSNKNNKMGTVCGNNPKNKGGTTPNAAAATKQYLEGQGRSSTIHSVILKEHKLDVYKKYIETEVLGHGSMGHVAKVKVKDGYAIGGSAYVGTSTHGKGGNKTALDAGKAKAALLMKGGYTSSFDVITTNTGAGEGGGEGESERDGGGSSGSSVNESSGDSGKSYALKSIILDRVSTTFIDELKNEIAILKALDHPNIVKLHEVFSHKKQIYMILELCDGGDLYTRLPYTEKDSAYVTGKLLSAIKYMHDHGIVHRDRKYI